MKTFIVVILILLAFPVYAFPPGAPPLIVEEVDGGPSSVVSKIVFTNDTLSVSGGTATVTIPASGSGGYEAWDADLDVAALANEASNSTYFGKDAAGNVGFYSVAPVEAGTVTGQLLVWNNVSGQWEAESSLTGLIIGGLSTTAGTAVVSDSSGYLSQSFTNFLPDAADGAALGSTAAEWSDAYFADGAVIYLGNDQDVTLTHVADVGVDINLALHVSGNLSGKVPMITKTDNYTLGTDSAKEAYGYIVWMSGASKTLTLPAVVAGMSVCLYSTDAAAKSVDPNDSDGIRMDAARDTDGHKITSGGAIGDRVCLVADSADGWTVMSKSGTWTAE